LSGERLITGKDDASCQRDDDPHGVSSHVLSFALPDGTLMATHDIGAGTTNNSPDVLTIGKAMSIFCFDFFICTIKGRYSLTG